MKKLSKLQRFILQETYQRHQINNPDILISWFGFKRSYYGSINFNPKIIGVEKYKSASVSVSRSLTRLRARGLMKRSIRYGYHELTPIGRQFARNG